MLKLKVFIILLVSVFSSANCSEEAKFANEINIVTEIGNKQLLKSAKKLQFYIVESGLARPSIGQSMRSGFINIVLETRTNSVDYNFGQLDDDGFIIKREASTIVISGKTDWGTEYGVDEFLERFLGIKWLMPGTLWTEISGKISLPKTGELISENPKFLTRGLSPLEITGSDVQSLWARNNRLRKRVSYGHNLYKIFQPSKLQKSKGIDLFPIIKGKKYIPTSDKDQEWQPDFLDKTAVYIAKQEILTFFSNNPNVQSFSLGINDSKNFDTKTRIKNLNYLKLENHSETYYTWVNNTVRELNQKLPYKTYGLLAYLNVATPPSFTLEKNIIPFITYERLKWAKENSKTIDIANTLKWKKKTNQLGWYDYVYGYCYVMPRSDFHVIDEYIKKGSALGVSHYVAEFYPNWLEGPKGWVLSKLLWNPSQNIDELLNDWYVNAVGDASSGYLKSFYELWEKFWTKEAPKTTWWDDEGTFLRFSDFSYVYKIPVDYVDKSDYFLKMALKNTQKEKHRKRMEQIIDMWNFNKDIFMFLRKNPNESIYVSERTNKLPSVDIEESYRKLSKNSINAHVIPYFRKFLKAPVVNHHSRMLNTERDVIATNNILPNGSFEDSMRNWTSWIKNNKGSVKITSHWEGKRLNCLEFNGVEAASIYNTFSCDILKNQNFVVKLDLHNADKFDSEVLYVSLEPLDVNKKKLSNSLSSNSRIALDNLNQDNKKEVSFNFAISANKKEIRYVKLQISILNAEGKKVYIDDIGIFKVN